MSLFSVLGIAASGMAAQRTRAELLVQNLANAETTRTPEGGPYRRKDVVFMADPEVVPFAEQFRAALGGPPVGVRVAAIVEDPREPIKRYMPGHPDADADGYVAFPRISPAEDMVDLLGAARAYQANVTTMSVIKGMIQRALELFR